MQVSKIVILNKLAKHKSQEAIDMFKDYVEFLSESVVEVMEYEWLTDLPLIEENARYVLFLEPEMFENAEKLSIIENIILKTGKANVYLICDKEAELLLSHQYNHLPLYFFPESLTSKEDLENLFLLDFVKNLLELKHTDYSKQSIYLASADKGFEKYRNYIKRELERRGYQVLPQNQENTQLMDQELTLDNEERIFSLMKDCSFSVHFGKQVSLDEKRKKGSQKYLENNIAFQLEKAKYKHDSNEINDFKRVIWDFHSDYETTADLEYVEQKSQKTEYLNGSVDQLKAYLLRALTEKPYSETKKKKKDNQDVKLYLIHKDKEKTYVEKLIENLKSSSVSIIKTNVSQDFDESRRIHYQALIECDACVIVSEKLDDLQWLNSKIQDVLKASGKRKDTPLVHKALLTKQKESGLDMPLDDHELTFLSYTDEANVGNILEFIKPVSTAINE